MSCSNIYDWTKQSGQHRAFASRHYPLAANLAAQALSYEQFARAVAGLPNPMKWRYTAEFNAWWTKFGKTWGAMSCPQELHVGEITDQYHFTDQKGRTTESGRMYLSGLGSPGACGACRGLGAAEQSDAWAEDWDIGTPAALPSLSTGWEWCTTPPSQSKAVGNWEALSGGWARRAWSSPSNVQSFQYYHRDTNVEKWACQKVYTYSSAADVRAIQRALIAKGYNVGSTGADGIAGKNTCMACYDAKKAVIADTGAELPLRFFTAIGVAGANQAFANRNARLCAMYYKDWPVKVVPASPAEPTKPTLPPGYNWCTDSELEAEEWTLGKQLADVGEWAAREVTGKNRDGIRYEHAATKTVLLACKPKMKTAGIAWILGLIIGGTAVGMIIRSKVKKK